MASWKAFEQSAPEMAQFGKERLLGGVSFLGTIRADGGPRVHPVTAIIGKELFLFMEPTSPKGRDLERDPRYTLHCAVEDNNGGGGEFYVRGHATLNNDPEVRAEAAQASKYSPKERYVLFVLTVDFAFMNRYIEGNPSVSRWRAND